MYYYVDKNKKTITILGFYAKTGKLGKPDLSKQEEKHIIEEYKSEYKAGILQEHEIVATFSIITP